MRNENICAKYMTEVFIVSDNIYSPLGATTAENFSQLRLGVSGVRRHVDAAMSVEPFYAALFDRGHFKQESSDRSERSGSRRGDGAHRDKFTKFELLLIASITDALQNSGIEATDSKTIFILSTTKGNIGLLETGANDPALADRVSLHGSARRLAEYFGFVNRPIVISNACISGIVAILTASRLIRSGQYDNAVVAGADVISKFILSGFQAFQAVSPGPCKPFDRARDGINLGEGAATVVLSANRKYNGGLRVMGGAVSNDANHLSAPSRTGEELSFAIMRSLQEAQLSVSDIDLISAHGTATVYNDEMEAKAIGLAHLSSVPVNSLKGYYGHTLGAAGLIESIVSMQSLREGIILPSLGFSEIGVSKPLNICTELLSGPLKTCLKIASGFGGCNAALIFGKS
jgi:3-oxoacyl-[acyl-carrier-protein] synthase-1